jgi:AraC family transcriptional regulator, positive regulator of tynA and feaB
MMTYTFGGSRSATTPAHLHTAMREGFGYGWDVNTAEGTDARMVIKAVPFGQMKLSLASLPRAEVSNVARPSSRTPDHPYNIYVSNRRHRVVTNNHSVILEPGDVTVADSAMAATMITNEPYTTIGLTVPAKVFRTYLPEPERAVGVRFSGKSGLSKIVSYLLLTMWEYAEEDTFERIAVELTHNLLGILSTCSQVCSERPETPTTNTAAKRDSIKRIINQNLHKPDLCVGEIAKLSGLSVRYVQRLFSEEEHTASEYIRRQRLEGCKKQLADPAWLHHSITEIAFNWGFNSSAHFARVFKAQCGINARKFRSQALLGSSRGVDGQDVLSPTIKSS